MTSVGVKIALVDRCHQTHGLKGVNLPKETHSKKDLLPDTHKSCVEND